MLDRLSLTTRRWLFLAWFVSGAVVAITMLVLWPFPVELQVAVLFGAFLILAMLRFGMRRPVNPIAFALGSVLPYVVVQLWLGSLTGNDRDSSATAEPPAESAAEEAGK